jgi:hypothetical protein
VGNISLSFIYSIEKIKYNEKIIMPFIIQEVGGLRVVLEKYN